MKSLISFHHSSWHQAHEHVSSNTLESGEVYNLPFGISSRLSSSSWVRYVPFCPPNATRSLDEASADANANNYANANSKAGASVNSLEVRQLPGNPEAPQIIKAAAL